MLGNTKQIAHVLNVRNIWHTCFKSIAFFAVVAPGVAAMTTRRSSEQETDLLFAPENLPLRGESAERKQQFRKEGANKSQVKTNHSSITKAVESTLFFSNVSSSHNHGRRLGKASSPHILFVLADDLGYHDVGYQGSGIPTPNIDRLAREGSVLSNYYVQPTCSPTRATILTGRHSSNHGVVYPFENFKPAGLPEDEVLLPEILRTLGYATHAVGKWHLGFYKETLTPTFRGFNTFYGFYGLGADYTEHYERDGYDFRREQSVNCGAGCSIIEDVRGQYSSTLFTERTKNLIRSHDPAVPLFIYLAWQAVHAPTSCYCNEVNPQLANQSRDPCFACMLMHADKGLGEITSVLADMQMLNDTIIIFTTDNGGAISTNHLQNDDVGSSNFPLRGGKHTLFEGGTHGVGLVWFGSQVQNGAQLPRVYDGIMGSVDWLPTLLTAAGVEHLPSVAVGLNGRNGKPLDGVSHFKTMISRGQGLEVSPPRSTLFIGASVGGHVLTAGMAIREGKWKLIFNAPCHETEPFGWSLESGSDLRTLYGWPQYNDGTVLLFDLSVDAGERNNVAEEQPQVVFKLVQLLKPHSKSPYLQRVWDVEDSTLVQGEPINGSWGPWIH
eukprot:TRINITY_DN4920_c0_g2_i1.p1 TRINITY_DN4920_c0_g2~~TRINITY_DN4920_c0_g2_i1.p1  ORF type:complete len:611 (+),score=57.39 TRINITY_DN4920_c0_g2_i1:48-1880(+)